MSRTGRLLHVKDAITRFIRMLKPGQSTLDEAKSKIEAHFAVKLGWVHIARCGCKALLFTSGSVCSPKPPQPHLVEWQDLHLLGVQLAFSLLGTTTPRSQAMLWEWMMASAAGFSISTIVIIFDRLLLA